MITLNLDNLFRIDSKHSFSAQEFQAASKNMPNFLEQIHTKDQGFYSVIDDQALVDSIHEFVAKNQGKFEHIVVLGIGGSSLGTICLQHSLGHLYKQSKPSLHVLDNIDPEFITELEEVIDYPKTLFIAISKSGATAETISEFFYFRSQLESKGLKYQDHFAFVTDPQKGLLREIAEQEEVTVFDLPQNVGGRFSVLTAVGLLPAALIGIDIDGLLTGARQMRDKFLDQDFDKNLPFQVATIQYLLSQKAKHINVLMPYVQKLNYFADWYKQLLAESIGKTEQVGLTPTKALGVTDQHSQAQLYNDGPNDKLLIFIETAEFSKQVDIPNLYPENPSLDYLNDLSFNKLIKIEKQGTADSLTQNNRPNFTIHIPKVNANTLGQLFMLFEGATAFLGEYFEIDAFNQPGVELSKKLTREYLVHYNDNNHNLKK